MQPHNHQPADPQRSVSPPPARATVNPGQPRAASHQVGHQAVARTRRGQGYIDAVHPQSRPGGHQVQTSPQPTQSAAEQWRAYHTAWQQYYQQYYQHYYATQAQQQAQSPRTQDGQGVQGTHAQSTQNIAQPADQAQATQPTGPIGSQGNPANQTGQDSAATEGLTQAEALRHLRQELRAKVAAAARRVRRSRHFVPVLAGVAVVIVFLFLQYNRTIFANVAAYVAPGNERPQEAVVAPTAADAPVGPDPILEIPKTNVNVPIAFGIGPDHNSQMKAMEQGVAHFAIPGANSTPGQVGNTVIAGHSSNDLLDGGNYKFIFSRNERLEQGDIIRINYQGKRYTYAITKKEVVLPSQVDKLIYPTDKPVLTLVSCVPLGTALKRLLVTAEQISPDPTKAAPAPGQSNSQGDSGQGHIPGNSPTLLERVFGRR